MISLLLIDVAIHCLSVDNGSIGCFFMFTGETMVDPSMGDDTLLYSRRSACLCVVTIILICRELV